MESVVGKFRSDAGVNDRLIIASFSFFVFSLAKKLCIDD